MPTLLQLDASPLDSSISRELGREFVATWKTAHPDGRLIYRDLALLAPTPVDAAWVYAAHTPEAARGPEQKAALAISDTLIQELENADEYVIGVPMHNFSIPATLKLWIDQIVRSGRTFAYGANGPSGLLQGKKATLVVATGGVYAPGTPMAAYDFGEPYLKTVLGFIGVTDVHSITVGGAAQLMSGAVDRATLLQPALEQIRAAAV